MQNDLSNLHIKKQCDMISGSNKPEALTLLKQLLNHLCGDIPLSPESLLKLVENNYNPDSLTSEIWSRLTVEQKKSAILRDEGLFCLVEPIKEQEELLSDTLHLIEDESVFFDLAKRSEKKLRLALVKFEGTPDGVITQLIGDNRTPVLNAIALHGTVEHRLIVAKKITTTTSGITDSSEIALTLLTDIKDVEAEMLIVIMNHPDWFIRAYALQKLLLFRDNTATLEALLQATADKDEYVAEHATQILEKLNDR